MSIVLADGFPRKRPVPPLARISILLLLSLPTTAFSTTKTWIAVSGLTKSGDWNIPGNWSPSGVPLSSDDVTISAGGNFDSNINYNYAGAPVTLSTLILDNTGPNLIGAFTALGMLANTLNANIEYFGYNGRGGINHGGGTNMMDGLYLGYNSGGRGIYNLFGSATLLTTSSTYIGNSGVGTFNISSGVHTAGGDIFLAFNPNSNGNYNLSGSGSLTTTRNIYVGYNALGFFTQTGGSLGLNGSEDLVVGFNADSTGAYTQSGGTATLSSTSNLVLGFNAGASGTYTLSGGSLSFANLNNQLIVGHSGSGVFIHSGSASILSQAQITLANNTGSSASYTLFGAGILICKFITVGKAGSATFLQSGGSNYSNDGFTLGATATGQGTYTLEGGQLSSKNFIRIGDLGTGSFVQSGGTHYVGDGATTTRLIFGGTSGSHGSYALSGNGVLTVSGRMILGSAGTASFSQTGGSAFIDPDSAISYALEMAVLPNSNATCLLAGNGILEVHGPEVVGSGGSATVTQTGGTHFISNADLTLAYSNTAAASYTLSGGALIVSHFGGTVVGYGGPATFTQTGGSHTIFGNGGLILANLAVASGTYTLSGGSLITPAITANTNGHFFFNGGNLSVSSLNLLGGTASFNINAATHIDSLTFNGTSNAWSGKLDLNRSSLLISSNTSNIRNQLTQGANHSAWNGSAGITSSAAQAAASSSTATALAYATGADFTAGNGLTTFQGLTFLSTDTLILYTLAGDANMDKSVTFADFLQLQNHYNQPSDWQGGDFNYDGSTTFADFLILQNNYNKTLSAGALQPAAAAAVPEPASALLLATPLLAFALRRRRVHARHRS